MQSSPTAKESLTTQELVSLLKKTRQAIDKKAKTKKWVSTPREGQGGGNAWLVASMDKKTRADIVASLTTTEVAVISGGTPATLTPAEPPVSCLSGYSDKQRDTALARLAILREIEKLTAITGKEAAIAHVIVAAHSGTLAPHIAALIPKANDKYKDGSKRGLSRRRLYDCARAYAENGEAGLVPQKPGRDMAIPSWAPMFFAQYQRPQKPSVALAYKDFCTEMKAAKLTPPSYWAVQRWLKKMAMPEAEAGRNTGNALLKLRGHKRRSTEDLLPGDVYTADGTTFDAEIQHPYNGQPYKPEVTGIVDVKTRRVVGLSLDLAESAFAVLDALRMACLYGGIPALFYTDNGPGYRNTMLEAPAIGMLARLGIELTNSIPGRPQGKGLMERAVKTICEDASKRMVTCTHKDMDTDSARKVYKLTREDIKKHGKSALLPTFEEFKKVMLARIEEYNDTPHRALPKRVDETTGKRRHFTPNEYWRYHLTSGNWEPVPVPEEIRTDLFMPSERRKVRNAQIQFYSGTYYAKELENYHGDAVEVRYDIWDATEVQVYLPGGPKICAAKLDGNVIPYFPRSRIEAARENRERAQIRRVEEKVQRLVPGARIELPEQGPRVVTIASVFDAPQPEKVEVEAIPHAHEKITLQEQRPIFLDTYQKYEWLMRNPSQQTVDDTAWLCSYAETEEYAEFEDSYRIKGINFKERKDAESVCAYS